MRLSWPCLVLVLAVAACGDDDDDKDDATPDVTTSKVEGKLGLASFTAGPTAVDAIDEVGVRTNAPLGPEGVFALELREDHLYRLVVLTPAGEVPIVFARPGNRLEKAFRVSSGNVLVSLGTIRHYPKNPETGITIRTGAPTDPAPCADGLVPGSSTACVEETLRSGCIPGALVDDDDDGPDTDEPRLAGTDEVADPAQPFALPDRNAPREAAGCDD